MRKRVDRESNLFSPRMWFNKLRQQLVDMRVIFRRDSAASSVSSLLRRRELLEKVWSAFLNSYIDVVLGHDRGASAEELSGARSHAALVYIDAKDLLDTAYRATAALDNEVQPIESKTICFKIEDHLLHILNIPRMTTFRPEQARELIDKVEFHARMVERIYGSTCPMMLCVVVELKLDDETYSEWKEAEDPSHPPNVWALLLFLEQRWVALYRDGLGDMKPDVPKQEDDLLAEATYLDETAHIFLEETPQTLIRFCRCCRTVGHFMGGCRMFRRWSVKKRVNFLARYRLCANCFTDGADGHDGHRCRARAACFDCGEQHHVLVCPQRRDDSIRRAYTSEDPKQRKMDFGNGFATDPWGYFDPEQNNYN